MLHLTSRYLRNHRKSWYALQPMGSIGRHLLKILVLLAILIGLHMLAMIFLEGLTVWQAFWLTVTTLTTVGYGDLAASTIPGQLATVCLLYIPGIALLGQFIGEYVDYRISRRERMMQGLWRWKDMKDHILILNTPVKDGEQYLARLVDQISNTPSLSELPIQMLTPVYPDGLPPDLSAKGVVHYYGTPTSSDTLDCVNVEEARYIFVICHDMFSINPDSQSIDILEHLNGRDLKAYVVAECVDDDNRRRFKRLAANTVIRPIRAYPELVVRAMVAPGTEQVMEELFTWHGSHPSRYEIEISEMLWSDIANRIMNAGLGTALAFIRPGGEVVTNPQAQEEVHARALIVLVNFENEPDLVRIKECLGLA